MIVRGFAELEGKRSGAEGNRTPGLLIANQPLSQLSYSPKAKKIIFEAFHFKKPFLFEDNSIFPDHL